MEAARECHKNEFGTVFPSNSVALMDDILPANNLELKLLIAVL